MKKKISLLSCLFLFLNLNSIDKSKCDSSKCDICGEESQKVLISRSSNKLSIITLHNWEFHFNHAKESLKESKSKKYDELIKIFNSIKYLPAKNELTLEVVTLLLKTDPQPRNFLLKEAREYIKILAKKGNIEAEQFEEDELKKAREL